MLPLIAPGETLWIVPDFYRTRDVSRNDYIAYRHPSFTDPLGKLVFAVPGDRWKIEKRGRAWRIFVNEMMLANSVGQPYALTGRQASFLGSYAGTDPTIPKNTYLILGDSLEDSRDSRSFGLVARADIVGKIVRQRPRP